MFDIGFTELLVIGVVSLIVVGPKDLPGMFRTLGRFTARARQMGREFSQAMTDAADETGAKDMVSTLKSATSHSGMGLDALNKAAEGFEKWDPAKALKDQKDGDALLKEKDSAGQAKETPANTKVRDVKAASADVISKAGKKAGPKGELKTPPKAAQKAKTNPVSKSGAKPAQKTVQKTAPKPKPKPRKKANTTDKPDA